MEPGSEALHAAAELVLKAQGVQWTDLRELVFRVLAETGEPSSAYAIAERVSTAAGRRIAANSIYRILDLYVAHDLAKRIESRNAYVVNRHPACRHDCIFLVCQGCATIQHLDDDRLAHAMRARATEAGFQPTRAVLEILGWCPACEPAAKEDRALP